MFLKIKIAKNGKLVKPVILSYTTGYNCSVYQLVSPVDCPSRCTCLEVWLWRRGWRICGFSLQSVSKLFMERCRERERVKQKNGADVVVAVFPCSSLQLRLLTSRLPVLLKSATHWTLPSPRRGPQCTQLRLTRCVVWGEEGRGESRVTFCQCMQEVDVSQLEQTRDAYQGQIGDIFADLMKRVEELEV